MWTLDSMRRFVLQHNTSVPCPSCKGSHRSGSVQFNVALVMYPEWNDETYDTDVRVGVDVLLDRFSCFCSLTGEEMAWCRNQAHLQLMEKLNTFLAAETARTAAPPQEAETRALEVIGA